MVMVAAHRHVGDCHMNPYRPDIYAPATMWEAMAVGHRARQGQAAVDLLGPAQAHLHTNAALLAVNLAIQRCAEIGRLDVLKAELDRGEADDTGDSDGTGDIDGTDDESDYDRDAISESESDVYEDID